MILLLIMVAVAWGAEVVIPEPNVAETEFRAYILAHPGSTTPTQALLRTRPDSSAREKLVALFAQSQRTFLEGEPAAARQQFDKLLSHVHDEDWSQTERQVFFDSALRRAQLSLDDKDRNQWLNLAVSLSVGLTPDHVQFPPPLIEQYKTAEKAAHRRAFNINGLGLEWTLVIINGVHCEAANCPTFPDAGVPVRITYLSDRWQPVTSIRTPSEISDQIPVRKAWLGGDCTNPRLDRSVTQFGNSKAFFGIKCEESKITANREIDFRPHPATPDAVTMFTPPQKEKPFYKSPWLWAGVGTALAILVMQNHNKREDKKEPSTTYGLH